FVHVYPLLSTPRQCQQLVCGLDSCRQAALRRLEFFEYLTLAHGSGAALVSGAIETSFSLVPASVFSNAGWHM
ncbi:unnamed protein product, partial [Mycena citricolor]